jgi:phosphopantothenoylcysteine decarboxylase/phosphopantothenate--cysteine ligase
MPSSDGVSLDGRRLLLGVTGSIAAYKAAPLVRRLAKAGAEVQVLMTEDAERFISALTLGTLSGREVLTSIFPEGGDPDEQWTKHVTLGLWADLFVVAPATAQTIAKLAGGFSDSMLTATALSARCPMLVCPAMDRDMYRHPATRRNLERLEGYGYEVMPAEHGELASGLVGRGRMPEPAAIARRASDLLEGRPFAAERDDAPASPPSAADASPSSPGARATDRAGPAPASPASPSANNAGASVPDGDAVPSRAGPAGRPLEGRTVLVTAGPTQEPIDPVRMLTNPSTGTMGYALARAAAARGATVALVSGPTSLSPPDGVEVVRVRTADEMNEAVQARRGGADLVFMAAAVADYTPAEPADTKLKKAEGDLTLTLRRTPDILRTLGAKKRPGQVLVGFALETDDGLDNARDKLERKNLDWVVLNSLRDEGAGFGPSTNRVTLLHRDGSVDALPRMPKRDVAEAILRRVLARDDALSPPPSSADA